LKYSFWDESFFSFFILRNEAKDATISVLNGTISKLKAEIHNNSKTAITNDLSSAEFKLKIREHEELKSINHNKIQSSNKLNSPIPGTDKIIGYYVSEGRAAHGRSVYKGSRGGIYTMTSNFNKTYLKPAEVDNNIEYISTK